MLCGWIPLIIKEGGSCLTRWSNGHYSEHMLTHLHDDRRALLMGVVPRHGKGVQPAPDLDRRWPVTEEKAWVFGLLRQASTV